ncbi:hypothetical protein P3T76_011305 [Phytophthora citrophthora]|uniref:Myosin-binding domain-containing protein n=1 Tax=Phytophthora citrophthora TaxID=4793 RepID=A0AAD9LFW9_9STRA|nr:hypothetical protein P3T76_011305 [Phytophthora citrophthora]
MTHPFYRPNTVKKLMEIAVTSSSPLGQYLAELITSFLIPSLLSELDAEAGSSESLAQILSTPQPVARKRPRRSTAQTLRLWEWLQLAQTIQRRVELVAVRRLIPKLCAFHPTIREELQQTVGYNATVFAVSYKGNGWWSRYIALVEVLEGVQVTQRFNAGTGGVLVVILAVVLGSWRWDTLVLKLLQWIAAVVFVLELSMKLWLGWYARRSQQLVAALQTFLSAMSNYDQAYGDSLTLVKRAELASRGYRLGAGLLPPIGRLEASSNAESSGENGATERQLRCLPLRRKLRTLNNQLLKLASRLPKEGEKISSEESETLVEREDDKAPSLLLTALTKQRNRSTLLLENAVRTELVTNVARSCSSSMSCNLFDTLISQRVEAEQLIKALGVWTDDLQVWNSTKNPVTLQTLDSSIHPTERQQDGQQAPSDPVDPQLNSVASQLHDLRSISETFTALTIASQHELLTDAAPEQLSSSRETMQSMIQQLQESWSIYNRSLDALEGKVSHHESHAGEEAEEEESVAVEDPSSAPAPEEPNCTVVFTGTSTGDEGFDLQALLKQQEVTDTASGPTPRFVRELQDVLAHREAHTRPTLTKQVDQDPPAMSKPIPEPPPPPAADAMFALPRAPPRGRPRRQPTGSAASMADSEPFILGSVNTDKSTSVAFNLELQALLQRVQPSVCQDAIESLSDSGEESALDSN